MSASMRVFKLPDLGEGLDEAEILTWHVSVGDHVVTDQPLVSVQTDKAVVEIPSPRSGRIHALHGAVGDRLAVGAPLVEFETGEHADAGGVVGKLPSAPPPPRDPSAPPPPPVADLGEVRAAPRARALARELGVDLESLRGTGPDGVITAADVQRAAGSELPVDEGEPVAGIRRAMALNMARSRAEVVPATLFDEADVDAWATGTDVTVRLVRAIAAGAKASPSLNASFFGQKMRRRLYAHVDVGIAVHTDEGLLVPVLRDVGSRDEASLRAGLERLKSDARRRTIPPSELTGQTITLSNFGMLGGRHAALSLLSPQVAIVGAGRIEPRVVAVDGQVVIRRLLPLSLTFDHRVVDGGEAARFLMAVRADLMLPS